MHFISTSQKRLTYTYMYSFKPTVSKSYVHLHTCMCKFTNYMNVYCQLLIHQYSIKFNHLHNISCHPLIPFWTHANNAIWLSCLAIFMCVFSCKLFHHHHHHHHYQWCKTFPIIPSTSRWPLNLSPWWTVYLRYHGYCLCFLVYHYSAAESPESLLI